MKKRTDRNFVENHDTRRPAFQCIHGEAKGTCLPPYHTAWKEDVTHPGICRPCVQPAVEAITVRDYMMLRWERKRRGAL